MDTDKSSNQSKIVFVGLSGGVDSSVAALRLKNQGCTVVGVFIKVWQPDWLQCNWEQERLDAMRVAAHLEIPFLTCDAEAAYKKEVGEYFIAEYEAGRTPNPDVLCNQHVKFGAFLAFAKERGADFVATGHYAQNIATEDGFSLRRGIDTNKDQSYFLWTLTQAQLQHILLPVGDTEKADIRKEAEAAGIPVAEKKDSQGVCFLGQIDIKTFMEEESTITPGNVLNEVGDVVGAHNGALIYTIGQRHGFSLHTHEEVTKPHFVIAKDMAANTITVAENPLEMTSGNSISLTQTNWIPKAPEFDSSIEVQFRYRQTPLQAHFTQTGITLKEAAESPAIGQSCVLYQGDVCLGGGNIEVIS